MTVTLGHSLKQTLKKAWLDKLRERRPEKGIMRIEVPVNSFDILSFLRQQPQTLEQFFWKDREGESTTAGVGVCYSAVSAHKKDFKKAFEETSSLINISDDGVKAFLGSSFLDHIKDELLWGGFGAYRFIIPRIELGERDGVYFIALHVSKSDECYSDEDLVNSILDDVCINDSVSSSSFQYTAQSFSPDKETWTKMVDELRHLIAHKKLHKAVLARQTSLTLADPIRVHDVLAHTKTNHCYQCFYQNKEGESFVTFSPERLFLKQNVTVMTEAIAGTRPRGETDQEDHVLEQTLMNSHKDDEEHQFVLDMIKEKLYSLCDVITETSSKSVLKLDYAQHLYFSVLGMLKSDISDYDVLRALHPTPAVGGFPTKEAVDFISLNEPFDRGWYSGSLALIEKEKTEVIVGIRSALLKEHAFHIFSGAGIVDRSISEMEWDELNTKITPFMSNFNDPR